MPSSINVGRPSMKRGNWTTQYCEVTAGQTFKVGDWVYKVAAGTLSIAAAADADIDVSTSGVRPWGRALANAADILALETGRQLCPVEVPDPTGQFLVAVRETTAAASVLAASDLDGAASTITLPMGNYSGQWCANKAGNGTDDCIVIVEKVYDQPWSEQYGHFWAQLIYASVRLDNP